MGVIGRAGGTATSAAALRRRRGGLFLLALFLGLSGAIRLAGGIGHALAETPVPEETVAPSGETLQCEPDGGVAALLASLREREARLVEQERKAAEREQGLALARKEIDGKLAELQAAEEKLAATLAMADQAAEKDVGKLVAMYETMKPKDAARLFGEMEPDFAAGFLAQMRPEAAAAVLAGLEPTKAYAISLMLAGRNAAAPKG
jgi:flagellar motility protein MotE (MotC chaperone)